MTFHDDFSGLPHTGRTFICLDSTDSTNLQMEELIRHGGMKDGSLVTAEYQTAGKGMLENAWESEYGSNLLFSLLSLDLPVMPADQFYISKAVSLGIHDYLSLVLPHAHVRIKWPNDILVNGRKLAGILIKCNLRGGEITQVITGIGLNVNQAVFPPHFIATSMSVELGHPCDKKLVLHYLLSYLEFRMAQLRTGQFHQIDTDYHACIKGIGEWSPFRGGNGPFYGRILEVGRDGRIHIEMENGGSALFGIREISMVRG